MGLFEAQYDCTIGSKEKIELPVVQNGTQLVMLISALSYFRQQGMDRQLGCDNCVGEAARLLRRAVIEAERLGLIEEKDARKARGELPESDEPTGGLSGQW